MSAGDKRGVSDPVELRSRARLALTRARSNRLSPGEKPPDPRAVAAMDSALKRMSGIERDVFLAMRVDNLSIEEIAERIGLHRDEVLRIFVRGFRNLERNLANPRRHWWRRWLG